MKPALLMLTCLVLLCTACAKKVTQAEEPRIAIEQINDAFTDHLNKFGSIQGYTIDEAMTDAEISQKVMDKWKFKVYGSPPTTISAVSTDEHPLGAGHRVVYDIAKKSFEGWMVRDTEDDE